MTVPYAFHYLLKNPLSLTLLQSPVLLTLQVAMQAATTHILHDQDYILRGVNHFIEANDVLVPHLLHQLDLSLDTLPPVGVHQLVLLIDLHSHFAVARLMKTHSDHSIGTLPNLFANDIVIKGVFVTEYHTVFISPIGTLCLLLSSLLVCVALFLVDLLFNLVLFRFHPLTIGHVFRLLQSGTCARAILAIVLVAVPLGL